MKILQVTKRILMWTRRPPCSTFRLVFYICWTLHCKVLTIQERKKKAEDIFSQCILSDSSDRSSHIYYSSRMILIFKKVQKEVFCLKTMIWLAKCWMPCQYQICIAVCMCQEMVWFASVNISLPQKSFVKGQTFPNWSKVGLVTSMNQIVKTCSILCWDWYGVKGWILDFIRR